MNLHSQITALAWPAVGQQWLVLVGVKKCVNLLEANKEIDLSA